MAMSTWPSGHDSPPPTIATTTTTSPSQKKTTTNHESKITAKIFSHH